MEVMFCRSEVEGRSAGVDGGDGLYMEVMVFRSGGEVSWCQWT
jgi:hypothetical protein